jgi:hypothetical protein
LDRAATPQPCIFPSSRSTCLEQQGYEALADGAGGAGQEDLHDLSFLETRVAVKNYVGLEGQ